MGATNADFHGDKLNLADVVVEHSASHDELPDGSGLPNTSYTRHYFTATHPTFGPIGDMQITAMDDDHQIVGVNTHKDFRRKGVATLLYRKALSIGLTPRHSDKRSDEGDAWAKSVGGDAPTNTLTRHK